LKFSKKDFHHASRPGDIRKDQRARLDKKGISPSFRSASKKTATPDFTAKYELKIQRPPKKHRLDTKDRANVRAKEELKGAEGGLHEERDATMQHQVGLT
jgi:hypothetical protein